MNEDLIIIDAYREAFRKHAKEGVIDMDEELPQQFNFQLHRLEVLIPALQGVVPPIRESQFILTLMKRGTGEKKIGHFTFPFHKNTLMIIPKRVIHSSRYWSVDCCGYYLSFNIEFFLQNAFPKHLIETKVLFKNSIRPYLILTAEQTDRLEEIYEYLIEEYQGEEARKNEMLAIKVLELIVLCDRYLADAELLQNDFIYHTVIEQFAMLIQKHYMTERTVAFYGKALNMHPNHLNSLVKRYTGLTAKETITDFVLTEAKFMLHSSNMTIKEIAYELGFDNPDQFSSFFRNKLDISPSQYKLKPI